MPSRNVVRQDDVNSYYHVYGRGGSKSDIFVDNSDKEYFLYLISRHLSKAQKKTKKGYRYPQYTGGVELLCYCLMDNHFHFLVFQRDKSVLSLFMKSILTAYTTYFNRKYQHSGPLLESRFKSSLIGDDAYLHHISRYIHLNPRYWREYQYSSLRYLFSGSHPEWLSPGSVEGLFRGREDYMRFLNDYELTKQDVKQIESLRADS